MMWRRRGILRDGTDCLAHCRAGPRERGCTAGAGAQRPRHSLIAFTKLLALLVVVWGTIARPADVSAQGPDGAACATNDDCSSGVCNAATGLCSRRAAARAPDGASCNRNGECHSGICNLVSRQCTSRTTPDSQPAGDGGACTADADCVSRACDLASRSCRPRAAAESPEGTACTSNADCRSGRCNAATGLCTRR
jgi:hypothetical protein